MIVGNIAFSMTLATMIIVGGPGIASARRHLFVISLGYDVRT
jgi:hypothetical protein